MASTSAKKRGLVLGGGGTLGAAWAVGALCALEEIHGFNPGDCDYIVGTSAGSVLGTLLAAGVTTEQLRDHQFGKPITEGPLAGYSWNYESAVNKRPGRPKFLGGKQREFLFNSVKNLGKLPPTAVLTGLLPEGSQPLDRIAHLVHAVTPTGEWSPHPNLWICAMNYATGTRVPFGRPGAPSAELAEAVRASCAIPAWFKPVEIDGVPYVDGGACSNTSVDLLANLGLDEVFVVAPMVSFAMDRPDNMMAKLERRWRVQVTKRCLREVEKVRASGTDVTVLGPGPADLEAIGANLMDVSRRLEVLGTSLRTSAEALRDPDSVGPDHMAEVG